MKPRLSDYIDHIRRSTTKAQQYVDGLELSEFLENEFVQDAVTMTLIVIGEAATKIMNKYPDFVDEHPEVPWRDMRNMRNRIAHGYFDINYEIVWETVHEWMPEMLQVLPILPIEPKADESPGMDGP